MHYPIYQSIRKFLRLFSSGILGGLLLCLVLLSGCSNGGGNGGNPDDTGRTLDKALEEEVVDEEVVDEQVTDKEIGSPINEVDAALRTVSVNSDDLSGLWVAHFEEKQPVTIVAESGSTLDTDVETRGFVVLHIEDHGDAISLAQCAGSADSEGAVYLDKQAAAQKQLSEEILAKLSQLLLIQPNENPISSPDLVLTVLNNTRMELGPITMNNPLMTSPNLDEEVPPELIETTLILQKVRNSGVEPIGTYESKKLGTSRDIRCFSFQTASWDWSLESDHSKVNYETWFVMSPSDVLSAQREPIAAYGHIEGDDSRGEVGLQQQNMYFLVTLEKITTLKAMLEGLVTKDGEVVELSATDLFLKYFQSSTSGDGQTIDPDIGNVSDPFQLVNIFNWLISLMSEAERYDTVQTVDPGLSYQLRYTSKENAGDEEIIRIQLTDKPE